MSKLSKVKTKTPISEFSKILAKEVGAETLSESKYGNAAEYISTGSYALNRIISGSIHKGIQAGAVTLLAGDSASGKSLFAIRIAANALNQNNYDSIIYVDSEGGGSKSMFESNGCDPAFVQHILVENIEECTIKLLNVFHAIEAYQESHPEFKALVILDSLGALTSSKLSEDASKDKNVSDMGSSAKKIGQMLRSVTIPAKKTRSPLLIISQIYDDPAALFKSKIPNIRGGKSTCYMPSVSLALTRKLVKPEGKDEGNGFYESTVLKAFTIKNREIQPFLETELALSFSHGFEGKEYVGLLEPAINLGFIKNPKMGWYQVPTAGEKMYRLKDLEGGPEAKAIWDTFIEDFDAKSQESLSYASLVPNPEADALMAELKSKYGEQPAEE